MNRESTTRSLLPLAWLAAALFSGPSPVEATPILAFKPGLLASSGTLIEFDELGLAPSEEFRAGAGLRFSLLFAGTSIDTGYGPSIAAAPNSTYAREFAPRSGPAFLNTISSPAANAQPTDLAIDFPMPVARAAAEIRSGQSLNDVDSLIFDLYRDGEALASVTVPIRGQDDFFFYGIADSARGFDRWVIRQRPDARFSVDNLRYAVPEPGVLWLALAGAIGLLLVSRGRRTQTPVDPNPAIS